MAIIKRIWSHLSWRTKITRAALSMKVLARRNFTTTVPLTDPGTEVTVCLTSFGCRLSDVYFVIESIGRGWVRPARLILWTEEEELAHHPPERLRRQMARGLEIRYTKDYGPHKKYFPYVMQYADNNHVLVTADDDAIYGRAWLRGLIRAHRRQQDSIVCYRAHKVVYTPSGVHAPYRLWNIGRGTTKPSVDNFATGVSGVLYTPPMLRELRRLGEAFVEVCPHADDVWLYFALTTAGWNVSQVRRRSKLYPWLPGTQETGLANVNVPLRNDEQIAQAITYFCKSAGNEQNV